MITASPVGAVSRLERNLTPEMWLRLNGLSPREAEVSLLAARGMRVHTIAECLQVAPRNREIPRGQSL